MYNIMITPNNVKEFSFVEEFLDRMNISFEKVDISTNNGLIILSDEEKKEIEEGLAELERGEVSTGEDVIKMMEKCVG